MRLSLFNLGPVKLSSLSNLPGVCVWENQPQLVFRFSTTPNSWYPEFPQNPFAYWSSSHTWLHGHNSIYHVNPFSVLGGLGLHSGQWFDKLLPAAIAKVILNFFFGAG